MPDAAVKEAPKVKGPQPYKMPPVELGDVVFWYADSSPHLKPKVAIVTGSGGENVCLNVLDPLSHNFILLDGVRHVSDPRLKAQEARDSGCWDYTPKTRRLNALLERFPVE